MFLITGLQRWLKSGAPRSGVSTTWVRLTPAELAPNDGGDRRQETALSTPSASCDQPAASLEDIAARLARTWEKLLGVESVALDDNYFDLGGDSSLTIQLFLQIERVFGIKLPVTALFDAPTVRELARAICSEASAIEGRHAGEP